MTFFDVRQIKSARKRCYCYWCAEPIEIGQPKTRTATVFEGDFQATNFHPECYSALQKWQRMSGDFGDYWPDCGTMARGKPEEKPQPCKTIV